MRVTKREVLFSVIIVLVMLMLGGESIRDVIAFPKVANSGELMTSSPSNVDEKQLDELGIAVCKQEQTN